MAQTRNIGCPHCGFLDTIKKVKEQAIHAIIVKSVRVISQIGKRVDIQHRQRPIWIHLGIVQKGTARGICFWDAPLTRHYHNKLIEGALTTKDSISKVEGEIEVVLRLEIVFGESKAHRTDASVIDEGEVGHIV